MSDEIEISKEEFLDWRAHKVTERVFQMLGESRAFMTEMLTSGTTINPEFKSSTEFVVGHIQGLNEVLNMSYEDSSEEKRDNYDH